MHELARGFAEKRDRPTGLPRVQSLGLTPGIECVNEVPEKTIQALLARHGPIRFSQTQDGSLHRVEALSADGRTRFVWEIDPELDWNARRVESWRDGRLQVQSVTEYDRINDVVLPISTAYFNANGELWALDQVESAEINAADLPRELVPEHIGIEQGTLLYVYGGDVFQQRYVADNQAVPSDEFWKLMRRGDVTPGPRVEARMVGRPVPLSIPDPKQVAKEIETARARWLLERPLDDWEKYTVAFIRTHKLGHDQRQKAVQILRSCQAERDHYLRGKRRQIEALEAKLSPTQATDPDAQPASPPDPRAAAKAREELERLRAPVQRIFEEKLKPRLDRLLTRAQRAAAEDPAAAPARETSPQAPRGGHDGNWRETRRAPLTSPRSARYPPAPLTIEVPLYPE